MYSKNSIHKKQKQDWFLDKSDLPLYLYAMHQHPDMQPLNIVTACRDTLYASNALFSDNCSVQDCKTACAVIRTNVTPIGYLSCDL